MSLVCWSLRICLCSTVLWLLQKELAELLKQRELVKSFLDWGVWSLKGSQIGFLIDPNGKAIPCSPSLRYPLCASHILGRYHAFSLWMLDLPKYIANICLAKRKSFTLCNKPFYRPRFLPKQTLSELANRCPSKFARGGHTSWKATDFACRS